MKSILKTFVICTLKIVFKSIILLQSHSPRVDDYLRAVKEHLHEAVTNCLRAAGHMIDEKEQRDLMRV